MTENRQRYAIHAGVFAALANPARHEIVHLLCEADRTPAELAAALEISRPNLSQHMAVLQREGLVKRSRADGQVWFQVIDPRLAQACALIDEILSRALSDRVHALETEASHVPSQ
jgi:DNA-binding transcriptional ArsR family regulator